MYWSKTLIVFPSSCLEIGLVAANAEGGDFRKGFFILKRENSNSMVPFLFLDEVDAGWDVGIAASISGPQEGPVLG